MTTFEEGRLKSQNHGYLLLSVFLLILLAPALASCVAYDVTFNPQEEWRVQVAFHGRLMTEQNIRAMVRAEVEEKAAIWRNRGARVSWNEESEVVEAEGRGWQLLNELLFGGQAVIRSTAIPGVMSISCDCSAALMQNATRPERRQAIEQISLRLNSNTILASNGSHGDAYWVWQWDNENLRVPESDKTIEAVLAVDWTWAIILFVMGCGGFTVLAGLTGAAGFFVLRRKRNASRLPRMA